MENKHGGHTMNISQASFYMGLRAYNTFDNRSEIAKSKDSNRFYLLPYKNTKDSIFYVFSYRESAY